VRVAVMSTLARSRGGYTLLGSAPLFPSNTVDITIGVSSLEEKAWIKHLEQSKRNENSGTACKLGAQPEI
jgi:hypothetical protein